MSRPLRSAPITEVSSLLRAGPPACAATVLNASQFLLLNALPLTTAATIDASRYVGACLPMFHTAAADQTHAACMPDTTWPIDGLPPGSSQGRIDTPVLMSFPKSRHVFSGSLVFVFLVPI
jgi:hypothetical protein